MQETSQAEAVEELEPLQMVLIVEDDATIGELLVQTLQQITPYQVVHVFDSFSALKTVRSVTPNLILLDYQLPGMDGLECLDALRSSKELEQTPIIFMSAHLPQQVKTREDVFLLEKPFELETVIHLVKQALGNQQDR